MITVTAKMTPRSPSAKLQKIKKDLEDRREVLNQTKKYMIGRWNENFAGNGAIYGGWAPNSPEWKEGGGKTLIGQTGELVSYFNVANHAGKVSRTDIHWHFANSGSQYSATHSTSGISPNPLKGHERIPRRTIWDMNETDRRRIVRMIEAWVDSKVTF